MKQTLAEVPRSTVQVAAIDLLPEDELRVKTMGLCVGRRVEVLQTGDPLIVDIAGAHVGVSRRLAMGIVISEPADKGEPL